MKQRIDNLDELVNQSSIAHYSQEKCSGNKSNKISSKYAFAYGNTFRMVKKYMWQGWVMWAQASNSAWKDHFSGLFWKSNLRWVLFRDFWFELQQFHPFGEGSYESSRKPSNIKQSTTKCNLTFEIFGFSIGN